MNILERIKKTSHALWLASQEKKVVMEKVMPVLGRIQQDYSSGTKVSAEKLDNLEVLLLAVVENLSKLKKLNEEEEKLNSELSAGYSNMLELDFDGDRDVAAHLATFTANLPVWVAGDPKLWSYMLGLVDQPAFAEGCESVTSKRLSDMLRSIQNILDIRAQG